MQNSESDEIQTVPKILVLGATGGTGRLIVRQAVARAYDVNVLVRSPEKARDLKGAKLIIGDARDEKALRKALKGRDGVVSALGTPASPFHEVRLLSSATRALVNAMKAEKVLRLVAITGIGAGDSVSVRSSFQLPTKPAAPISAPSSISVSLERPRQMTMIPGGGSPARAR